MKLLEIYDFFYKIYIFGNIILIIIRTLVPFDQLFPVKFIASIYFLITAIVLLQFL